jgi:hypothetical protein
MPLEVGMQAIFAHETSPVGSLDVADVSDQACALAGKP